MLLNRGSRPGLAALALLGSSCVIYAADPGSQALSRAEGQRRLAAGQSFYVQNVGQWNAQAKFLSRQGNLNVWVTDKGLRFDLAQSQGSKLRGQVVDVTFTGAQGANYRGESRGRLITDFLASPNRRFRASSYGSVVGANLYKGIDVRHYLDGGRPRFDLIVKPGVDVNQAGLTFRGASGVDAKGDSLTIKTSVGKIPLGGLYAYQSVAGKRVRVPASFRAIGKDRVAFQVGAYDHSKTLVIDPLIYGTYYGGEQGVDEVRNVVSDAKGGTYLVGYTRSRLFPAIYGPYGFNLSEQQAFITKLQGDAYKHDYAAFFGGSGVDSATGVQVDQFGDVWVSGETASTDFPSANQSVTWVLKGATGVTAGTFKLGYDAAQTADIPFNATAAQVESALAKTLGTNAVDVTASSADLLSAGGAYRVTLPPGRSLRPTLTNGLTGGVYEVLDRATDIFLIRFKQSEASVLDPVSSPAAFVFGGDQRELVNNFSIVPSRNTSAPVRLIMAGNIQDTVDGAPSNFPLISNGAENGAFLVELDYNAKTGVFSPNTAVSRWIEDGSNLLITGLTTDPAGSVYVAGTVFFSGNVDTSLSGTPFTTTAGVYAEGRLLRNADIFVRKYSSSGAMTFSTLVGGNSNDQAGGWDMDIDGSFKNVGSCVAVDRSGAVYVVGISRSFNFPRTRGVFGEVFSSASLVTLTKLNPDASKILFSTHLGTSGAVLPGGVAVDAASNVFITGNCHPNAIDFPDTIPDDRPDPTKAGNPNEPSSQILSIIRTTSDALDPAYTVPASQKATTEGFLTVVNPTATALLYSSYLGGDLDEQVYGPYVDEQGDVWVTGWSDARRRYLVTPTQLRSAESALPDALISPLAFKRFPDTSNSATFNEIWGNYNKWSGSGYVARDTTSGTPRPLIATSVARDGFINKMRIGSPAINALSISVSAIRGGNEPTAYPPTAGTSTTATISLAAAAPAGGITVQLSLVDDLTGAVSKAADFGVDAKGVPISTREVVFAAGATAQSIPINVHAVQGETTIRVRADYLNSFRIANFKILPWLKSLALGKTSLIGGSTVDVKVGLIEPAGAAGLNVTVDGISKVDGKTVYIEPQTINFAQGEFLKTVKIKTRAIPVGSAGGSSVDVTLWAYVDGKTRNWLTTDLTLTPKTFAVKSLVFKPSSVVGGDTSTGTITLNTAALDTPDGAGVSVKLINPDSSVLTMPASVLIPTGSTTGTFTVTTKPIKADATYNVGAQFLTDTAVNGTLKVLGHKIASIKFNPTPLVGGDKATATVTLNYPAPASTSFKVTLSTTATAIKIPTSVTIPAGASTATFEITSKNVTADVDAVISAVLLGAEPFTATLPVKAVKVSDLTFNPNPVVGGNTSVGTVKLNYPAPATGITVKVASGSSLVTVPTTVTLAAGVQSATFTATSKVTSVDTDVKVTATALSANPFTGTLTVKAHKVSNLTFAPNPVVGGNAVVGTVTLNSPAPTGAPITVYLTNPNANVLTLPATVTVAAGATTATFDITTTTVANDSSLGIKASAVKSGANPFTGTLTVKAHKVIELTFNPNPVVGGNAVTGSITINNPAPASGVPVKLVSSSTVVSVPSLVTVPAGATTVTFSASTVASATDVAAVVTATTLNANPFKATLNVVSHKVTSLSLSPSSVAGGLVSTGTVVISNPAPAGGIVVTLGSSVKSVATAPASVTVPAGSTSATFTVSTFVQKVDATSVITAAALGKSPASATLTVIAHKAVSLSFAPSSVVGGFTSTGTVTLNQPAPAAGIVVSLASTNGKFKVPATVTVPAGATSVAFTGTATVTASDVSGQVTAKVAGLNPVSANVTVLGHQVVGVSFNPNPVEGGFSAIMTLTLSQPAPAGGLTVSLTNTNASIAAIPAAVTVPAGATAVQIAIGTASVPGNQTVRVTATVLSANTFATNLTILRHSF